MTPGIEKGREWAEPAADAPGCTVDGDDADLAARLATAAAGELVWWRPTAGADLARELGLAPSAAPRTGQVGRQAVRIDGIDVLVDPPASAEAAPALAVNAVVLGPPPHRLGFLARRRPVVVQVDGREVFRGPATTVVVANGQFLAGHDVVPRGHPGDGRLEVQVYALRVGERGAMRRRLSTGTHVPHPRIATAAGRAVEIRAARPRRLFLDGRARGRAAAVVARVRPGLARILV